VSLYSLGVTFYELLVGALPFTAADPMERFHCHIARAPIAPTRPRQLQQLAEALEACTETDLACLTEAVYGAMGEATGAIEEYLEAFESLEKAKPYCAALGQA
jgi:serine/threonine protein kinase